MLLREVNSFKEVQKSVAEAAFVVVLYVYYCLFVDRNSGKSCYSRISRNAYFTIFKVNCKTLANRRQICRK